MLSGLRFTGFTAQNPQPSEDWPRKHTSGSLQFLAIGLMPRERSRNVSSKCTGPGVPTRAYSVPTKVTMQFYLYPLEAKTGLFQSAGTTMFIATQISRRNTPFP